MAQIAVERRGGGLSWWVWLIIALIVIGIIWYFAARGGNNNTANTTQPRTGEAARMDTSGAMTDLALLYNPVDAGNYVGRSIDSGPVQVRSTAGKEGFWVGPDRTHQVLVIRNQQGTAAQPGTAATSDVNPGQMVRVHGTVERFPGYNEARQRWNVDQNMRPDLEKQSVYINADRVDIVSRP